MKTFSTMLFRSVHLWFHFRRTVVINYVIKNIFIKNYIKTFKAKYLLALLVEFIEILEFKYLSIIR